MKRKTICFKPSEKLLVLRADACIIQCLMTPILYSPIICSQAHHVLINTAYAKFIVINQ